MRVTLEEVERIASLSMLSLDEEKKKDADRKIWTIYWAMRKKLNELDTEGGRTDFVYPEAKNVVREDVPGGGWEREDMLLNAPEKEDEALLPCLERSWIDGGNKNNGTYGIKLRRRDMLAKEIFGRIDAGPILTVLRGWSPR